MLKPGSALKVVIYLGEAEQSHHRAAFLLVLDFLFYRGVAGATVTRGIAGFGADRHLQAASLIEASDNLPIKIEFIESEARVQELLPKLRELVGHGMIAAQPVEVLQAPQAHTPAPAPEPLAFRELRGKAKLMRIYVSESDQWHGQPLHEAIVQSLRAHDMAGATVYRGILGYGASGRMHQERRLPWSHDCPLMLSVVDDEAKIRAYLPVIEEMVAEGLLVLSDVEVIKYTHRTEPAGAPKGEQA